MEFLLKRVFPSNALVLPAPAARHPPSPARWPVAVCMLGTLCFCTEWPQVRCAESSYLYLGVSQLHF